MAIMKPWFVPSVVALVIGLAVGAQGQKKTPQWDVQSVTVERTRVTGETPTNLVDLYRQVDAEKEKTYRADLGKLTAQGYEPFSVSAVAIPAGDSYTVRSEVWLRKLR